MKQMPPAGTSEFAEVDRIDRRRHSRFRAAGTIRFPNRDLFGLSDALTEDVSCRGFSFLAQIAQSPAAEFYCGLVIPDNGAGGLALLCRAHVVSTASHKEGGYRVGCRIEDYSILPDTAS